MSYGCEKRMLKASLDFWGEGRGFTVCFLQFYKSTQVGQFQSNNFHPFTAHQKKERGKGHIATKLSRGSLAVGKADWGAGRGRALAKGPKDCGGEL